MLKNGSKPSEIQKGALHIQELELLTNKTANDGGLLKMVSDTFGQFITKQSETFSGALRQLQHFDEEIQQIKQQFTDVQQDQSSIVNRLQFINNINETEESVDNMIVDVQKHIHSLQILQQQSVKE